MKRKLDCVLLIDDDEPTNFLNKMIIEETGMVKEVKVAQSAREALEYLSGKQQTVVSGQLSTPELILLDINMPAMDGWEFLERYDKLSPELKASIIVVMLTTSFNPEDELKASRISYISSFRNKPLTQEIVLGILEKHFGWQHGA
ncbi:response regulator [Paraflavitalea speifideaquila]|uniref:response regulator n=1 Tax=Paraflavitalea speifideaquila TaxID=3076558 RepID=UPI0028E94D61|nr:response regulator [Paraflavitalea speifideiaquila]